MQTRDKSQIGIWYSVWYNDGPNCFWDDEGCGSAGHPIYYKPLLPDGTYGRYHSGDDAIIQYHLQQIADAQIDFIIMDQTNMIDVGGGYINRNALKVAQAIQKWNESGKRPIRYCSGIGALACYAHDITIIESEAKILWERYCTQPFGTERDHMFIDGKPLMVIFETTEEQWNAYDGDKTYTNKFTLRFSVGHAYAPGMWGWVCPRTNVTEDVCCVMPGWYKFNHPAEKVYRKGGASYRKAWETLLASDIVPNYVVINSFNEYAEHTAVYTARTDDFPADYPLEHWIDENGNDAPSLYWDMTKEYIQKYKNGDRK